MKKMFCILVCLFVGISGVAAFANEGQTENIYENFAIEKTENSVIIKGCVDKTVTEIYVPGYIDSKKVVISEKAFYDYDNLERITFGEEIEKIPNELCYDCKNLKSVKLSGSITELGDSAFANCGSLTTVEHEGSIKKIDDWCFSNTALKEFDFLGVEFLGNRSFAYTKLENIYLPDLKDWDGIADSDVDEETNEHKEASVAYYPLKASELELLKIGTPFMGCHELKTVKIKYPETEKESYKSLFTGCENIESITFENFPARPSRWEFYNTEIVTENYPIPDGAENMNKTGLIPTQKKALKMVEPELKFTIYGSGDDVKAYADSLGVPFKEIELNSFAPDEELILDDGTTEIKWIHDNDELKRIVLPSTIEIENIKWVCIEYCKNLEVVEIYGDHEKLSWFMADCPNLKKVIFHGDVKVWDDSSKFNFFAFKPRGKSVDQRYPTYPLDVVIVAKEGSEVLNNARDNGFKTEILGAEKEEIDENAIVNFSFGEDFVADKVWMDVYNEYLAVYNRPPVRYDDLVHADLTGESIDELLDIISQMELKQVGECEADVNSRLCIGINYNGKKRMYLVIEGDKLTTSKGNYKIVNYSDIEKIYSLMIKNSALERVLVIYNGKIVKLTPYIVEGVPMVSMQQLYDFLGDALTKEEDFMGMTCYSIHYKSVMYSGRENLFDLLPKYGYRAEWAEDGGVIYITKEIGIKIDDKDVYFDSCPYIKNNRTMVPMRAIFEALGATVSWDDSTKTAIGVKDSVEVKIAIGENVLYKNGEAILLDCAAEITNGRTMVPVRAISEAFGCTVDWNDETKTVEITN